MENSYIINCDGYSINVRIIGLIENSVAYLYIIIKPSVDLFYYILLEKEYSENFDIQNYLHTKLTRIFDGFIELERTLLSDNLL